MTTTTRLDRRSFLTLVGAFGATLAAPNAGRGAERLLAASVGTSLPYAGDNGRILVTIQLGGGNDGLNTVVPLENPALRSLRGVLPNSAQMHELGEGFALNAMPYLAARWAERDLAIVHGVTSPDPSLSHFASTDVWARGSMAPSTSSGWAGRAVELSAGADADPLMALSLGGMPITLQGDRVRTMSLQVIDERLAWSPADRRAAGPLVDVHKQLAAAAANDSPLAAAVRRGHRSALEFGSRVGHITDKATDADLGDDPSDVGDQDEPSELGAQLEVVAELISAGLPTRAYQVVHGDYDTHEGQIDRHPALLAELDRAIAGFYGRLGDQGDRVVVATWSEFGRRPRFNGSGTDHGTASVGLVIGRSIAGGHHGEPPDLTRLDPNGNLIGAIDFRRYLGGIGQAVFDVDGARVADHPEPLALGA